MKPFKTITEWRAAGSPDDALLPAREWARRTQEERRATSRSRERQYDLQTPPDFSALAQRLQASPDRRDSLVVTQADYENDRLDRARGK